MNAITKQKPTHRAFTIVKNGERSWWHQIGAAWKHADNEGLSIKLFAVPVDGQVVLRTITEKIEETDIPAFLDDNR